MTRKHFVALATALALVRPLGCKAGDSFGSQSDLEAAAPLCDQWEATIQAVAAVCRSQNANFDRERFLDACYDGRSAYED